MKHRKTHHSCCKVGSQWVGADTLVKWISEDLGGLGDSGFLLLAWGKNCKNARYISQLDGGLFELQIKLYYSHLLHIWFCLAACTFRGGGMLAWFHWEDNMEKIHQVWYDWIRAVVLLYVFPTRKNAGFFDQWVKISRYEMTNAWDFPSFLPSQINLYPFLGKPYAIPLYPNQWSWVLKTCKILNVFNL